MMLRLVFRCRISTCLLLLLLSTLNIPGAVVVGQIPQSSSGVSSSNDEGEEEETTTTTKATEGVSGKAAATTSDNNNYYENYLPHVLTSRNFGSSISDGNVWLVEVYAPWCGHCVSFAPTYNEIASHYHSEEQAKLKIRVGKIDGDAERALSARFHVSSYPSFYVIDGWSVYEFSQSRTRSTLMKYVEGGYKTDGDKMPMYSSPLGPVGLAQGMLLTAGFSLSDTFLWLQNSFGLSPIIAGMALFGGCFVGCFIMIVVLAIAMTPKDKQD